MRGLFLCSSHPIPILWFLFMTISCLISKRFDFSISLPTVLPGGLVTPPEALQHATLQHCSLQVCSLISLAVLQVCNLTFSPAAYSPSDLGRSCLQSCQICNPFPVPSSPGTILFFEICVYLVILQTLSMASCPRSEF